jgi:hypothetical protein
MFDKKVMGLLHSNGIITTKRVAAPARSDVRKRRHPLFFKIRNAINGSKAMLWGFVKIPRVKVTAESSGFEAKANMSDRTRKKV